MKPKLFILSCFIEPILFIKIIVLKEVHSFSIIGSCSRNNKKVNSIPSGHEVNHIINHEDNIFPSLKHILTDVGVTSIISPLTPLANDNGFRTDYTNNTHFYIGTKRGRLYEITLGKDQRHESHDISSFYFEKGYCDSMPRKNNHYSSSLPLKPYPIYSMDCNKSVVNHNVSRPLLLSGGGDRYVTIWQAIEGRKTSNDTLVSFNDSVYYGDWKLLTRLGPHTGWVKDVIFDASNQFIYSIGCNCIEIWSKSICDNNDSQDHNWEHNRRLQIDSCKETGSTLSSDLLCLCLIDSSHFSHVEDSESSTFCHQASYLCAGGVDGRIHVWSIQNKVEFNHIQSISDYRAHNGRVNKMIICKKLGLLISVGHDGCIQYHEIHNGKIAIKESFYVTLDENQKVICSNGDRLRRETAFSTSFQNEDDDLDCNNQVPLRLLSMCCLCEDDGCALFALGTSSGIAFVIKVLACNSYYRIDILNQTKLSSWENNHAIHDISCVQTKLEQESDQRDRITYTIALGHSNGVALWDINNN